MGVIYQLLPKGYSQEGKKRIVNSVGEYAPVMPVHAPPLKSACEVAGQTLLQLLEHGAEAAHVPAGFGWQIGWYFEIAWQLFFVQDTAVTMWVSMFLLLGAFLGFAITLLSLYR